MSAVDSTIAQCLSQGDFHRGFRSFMQTCVGTTNTGDTRRALHVINTDDIKAIFENEQATATDLITSFQGIQTILGNTNVNQSKLDELTNNLDNINKQIEDTNTEIEAENQKFVSTVTEAPNNSDYLGNLQDIALGLFFFSLFLITIILTVVQYARPDGSIKLAGYTLLGMMVAILVIYGLLKEIA